MEYISSAYKCLIGHLALIKNYLDIEKKDIIYIPALVVIFGFLVYHHSKINSIIKKVYLEKLKVCKQAGDLQDQSIEEVVSENEEPVQSAEEVKLKDVEPVQSAEEVKSENEEPVQSAEKVKSVNVEPVESIDGVKLKDVETVL